MTTPYDQFPRVLEAVALISQGYTKTAACDRVGLSIPTFEQYCRTHDVLREALTEAEQRGYDAMADALLEIDNHKIYGQSDPKMAKVISDNIKWLLSKRRIKDYGDRVQVDHSISMDSAITAALVAGRNRLLALEDNSNIIDVTPHEETDEEIMATILGT